MTSFALSVFSHVLNFFISPYLYHFCPLELETVPPRNRPTRLRIDFRKVNDFYVTQLVNERHVSYVLYDSDWINSIGRICIISEFN